MAEGKILYYEMLFSYVIICSLYKSNIFDILTCFYFRVKWRQPQQLTGQGTSNSGIVSVQDM